MLLRKLQTNPLKSFRRRDKLDGMRLSVLSMMVLLLPGCFLFSKSPMKSIPVEDLPKPVYGFVPPAADRFPYGPVESFHVGEWATYRVIDGDSTDLEIKIAVVAPQTPGFWIETTIHSKPDHTLLSQWVDSQGRVVKSFYAEPGRPMVEQTLELVQIPPISEWPKFVKEEIAADSITIDQRLFQAEKVVRKYVTEDGQTIQDVTWWSSEVFPLYASRQGKGLMRRQDHAGHEVLLLHFGTGAQREMTASHN